MLWSPVGLKPVIFLPPPSSVGIQVCAQKRGGFLYWLYQNVIRCERLVKTGSLGVSHLGLEKSATP